MKIEDRLLGINTVILRKESDYEDLKKYFSDVESEYEVVIEKLDVLERKIKNLKVERDVIKTNKIENKDDHEDYDYDEHKEYLTVKQMAKFLNTTPSVLYGRVRSNNMPHKRVGISIMFNKQDVLDDLEQKKINYANKLMKKHIVKDSSRKEEVYDIGGVEYMTVKEAAQRIHVSPTFIYARINQNVIHHIVIGKSKLVKESDVRKIIENGLK